MLNTNEAIQLIRQGRKDEARRLLEVVLKANPRDIPAWFWYVETCATVEQRIRTLEVCLKLNPGNPQVLKALQALQPPAPAPTPPPGPSFDEPPEWAKRTSGVQVPASQPVPSQPVFTSAAFQFDDEEPLPATPASPEPGTGWQQSFSESKPAFDWEALEREHSARVEPARAVFTPEPEPVVAVAAFTAAPAAVASRPAASGQAFYQIWWQALTVQDVGAYAALLDDPEAGSGRAFEWMAYTSALTGLLTPLLFLANPQFAQLRSMPEFQQVTGRVGMTMMLVLLGLVMAVATPLFGVLGLALNGGLQNLSARFFGGQGTFGRTVYALAMYLVPFSLLTTLLNLIPVVGPCLSAPLGFYSLVLNVRALRAAHGLATGRAIGALLAPGLVLMVVCCLLGFLLSALLPASLRSLPTG